MRRIAVTPCSRYMYSASVRACVRADPGATGQQLLCGAWCMGRAVFLRDAIITALLVQVLAQQLAAARIEHSHDASVPLHFDATTDPTRRRAVVGSIDFDAAVEVNPAVAE